MTPTSGSAPTSLSVQPNITGLSAGTYTTTITVSPSTGAAQQINVTLTISPAGLTTLLGEGNIESAADNNTAGLAEAFPTTATASGTLVQLRVYVDQGNTASNLVAGLYTSSGIKPAQLLTQGQISKPVTGAWTTTSVPATAVTSGTSYWIAILSPSGSGTLNFRDREGGGTSVTSTSTTLSTLPTTWTTGASWNSSNLSATGLR